MKNTRTVNINIIFIIVVVFIFGSIIYKLCYIGLASKVDGVDIKAFAMSRNTKKETIYARRGSIYTGDGEILAKDVNSYTVIAYLSSSRTKDPKKPHHVVDKEATAEALSPLINMTKEKILELLNIDAYQVELGPGGRGITELLKDEIDNLDLPGIDFISSSKRYYPSGDFLSYTIGYAKSNEKHEFSGEMGIESYFNKELTGENGYKEYQADNEGYQITNMPEVLKEAVPGNDIYLTIDNNIQMFVENALDELEGSKPEWATLIAVEAKTGKILGLASSPSFNNNTLEIKSYYDPAVSYEYEPGSTMKIFSFMASMENGLYDGTATYKSGSLKVDDATIKDWNRSGWGTITYDEGFYGSSNVAASKLALEMGRAKLKDYYLKLGFGKQTGIELPNESKGIINFKYNTEVASSSFGQGITVNVMQMVQALTSLCNDGMMLKPYIVSKILDSKDNVVVENTKTEVDKVASSETVNKMLDLMRGVVDGRAKMSTGKPYYLEGYDLVGKTGTAEIASDEGGYLSGSYVRSFAGIFPGNDPQIIVYGVGSKMSSSSYLQNAIKAMVKDISTYLNIYSKTNEDESSVFKVASYINKDVAIVNDSLKSSSLDPIVIGNGTKIIKQFPEAGSTLNAKNKVFLLTNGSDYTMPNIIGWSRQDVTTYASLIDLKVNFVEYGYVKTTSIAENTKIDTSQILEIVLEKKYIEEVKKEENE